MHFMRWGRIMGVFLLVILCVDASGQTGESSVQENQGTLQQFIRLNRELPKAICDKNAIDRPPQINLGLDSTPIKGSVDFWLYVELDERKIIQLLLEDPSSLLWTQEMQKRLQVENFGVTLGNTKKQTSKEICTSLVTPGHFKGYFETHHGLFFQLKISGNQRTSKTRIRLQDPDRRFARIRGRWYVAGWIEPYEIQEIHVKTRIYRRLAHPVTNQTQYIQIENQKGFPLGYLYPSNQKSPAQLGELLKENEKESVKKKKISIYRTLIENDAYRMLKSRPKKMKKIRRLQEFYKNLVNAYELYPGDNRFSSYYKKSELLRENQLRMTLDQTFFRALAQARVNQAYVGFQMFHPDQKLHSIYLEYQKRLREI